MKKRGVSPLIATVLLIGFVIMIAVAVFFWYNNLVKGEIEKEGAKSEIDVDCASLIDLNVLDVSPSGDKYTITIVNTGSEVFNGIRFLAYYGNDNIVLSEKEMFAVGETKDIIITCDECVGKSIDKVEIMPIIVRKGIPGTCSSKKISYDLT